jgi:hypothetical protein
MGNPSDLAPLSYLQFRSKAGLLAKDRRPGNWGRCARSNYQSPFGNPDCGHRKDCRAISSEFKLLEIRGLGHPSSNEETHNRNAWKGLLYDALCRTEVRARGEHVVHKGDSVRFRV